MVPDSVKALFRRGQVSVQSTGAAWLAQLVGHQTVLREVEVRAPAGPTLRVLKIN